MSAVGDSEEGRKAQRKAAMAVLAHATPEEIAGHLAAIPLPAHENLREAENGLVMLRGWIGGDGAPFNLGEATVSRAAVRLASGEVGFGYTLGRDRDKARMPEGDEPPPRAAVTLAMVAAHTDHVVKLAGIDHVGIGSDFDGVESLPDGLDSVATYPALLAELMRRGWTDEMIAKLAGGNVLRVMEAAERVAASMAGEPPVTATVKMLDGK